MTGSTDAPRLFASYARQDAPAVRTVVDAVRRHGIDVWLDVDELRPGEVFADQVRQALSEAAGILVFLSAASCQSEYVRREVVVFAAANRLVIPVSLERVISLPPALLFLSSVQRVDVAVDQPSDVQRAARLIAQAAAHAQSPQPGDVLHQQCTDELAASIAADKTAQPVNSSPDPPRSVFIVHGHDGAFLAQVEACLQELGVQGIVLRQIGGPAQSLFQKFMQWGKETRFAIVLLTADDMGASRAQYEAEGVGERCLRFRARQNVVMELGFFYGHLGWENVFVLFKAPNRVFPDFERPSDLDGVVFDHFDESGRWKEYLRTTLAKRGFAIAAEAPNKGMEPTR